MYWEFEDVQEKQLYSNHGTNYGSEWVGKVKVNGINFKFSINTESGYGRLSEKDGLIHNPDSFFDNNEIAFIADKKYLHDPKLAITNAFLYNADVEEYFKKAVAEKAKKMSVKLFDNVMKNSMNLD